MANDAELKLTAMLAEYQKLNTEIQNRSTAQNLIIQIHGAALTVILGVIISGQFLPWLIFLIPISSAIFGTFYLDHDITIGRIGSYIQMKIEPDVNALLDGYPALEWEAGTAKIPQTMMRHFATFRQLIIVTFAGPCWIALIASAALLLITIPGIRGWLDDIGGSHFSSQIPVFYPGLTWIVGILALLISLGFVINYTLYSREGSRLARVREAAAQARREA